MGEAILTIVINDEYMEKLHEQFLKLGKERNQITYQLLAILPKIFKSGIYRKYVPTIEEYAGRYAGIPKSTVKKTLRLDNNLKDKPKLRAAIQEVGVHKISLIAKVATAENEHLLVQDVKNMSKAAVAQFARELRGDQLTNKIKIELNEEMTFLFLKIKQKLRCNTNKEAIQKILKGFHKEICPEIKIKAIKGKKSSTRTIPKNLKINTLIKSNFKCSYPNCNKPAEEFHHQLPWAISKNHNSIIPLCKNHHQFAHCGVIENTKSDVASWKINSNDRNFSTTDLKYLMKRQI